MEYLLDNRLLALKQVNLIGGPSGAGKSTLMFQLYRAITKQESFFGLKARSGTKWAYIAADRTEASIRETQKRVEVDFPIYSLVDRNQVGADLLTVVLPMTTKFFGFKPDFFYIDGFTSLCPQGKISDYKIVAEWLANLQRYCAKVGVTILGACHTSKTRENEKLIDPRQRIIGSTAWASYSEDMIIIDPVYADKTGDLRDILLLPRNGAMRVIRATFAAGVLEPIAGEENKEDAKVLMAEFVMGELIPGATIESNDLMEFAVSKGISRRTFYNYLKKLTDLKKIEKISRGAYRVLGDERGEVTKHPREAQETKDAYPVPSEGPGRSMEEHREVHTNSEYQEPGEVYEDPFGCPGDCEAG